MDIYELADIKRFYINTVLIPKLTFFSLEIGSQLYVRNSLRRINFFYLQLWLNFGVTVNVCHL